MLVFCNWELLLIRQLNMVNFSPLPRTTTRVAPGGSLILASPPLNRIGSPPSRGRGRVKWFAMFSCRINKNLKIAVIPALMGNCAGLGPGPALGRRSF
jgi:hypothetical protein